MASIVNNPKYSEGHKVAFAAGIPDSLKKLVISHGYKPVETIFSLAKTPASQTRFKTIQIGSDKSSDVTVFLKDPDNNLVKIKGTKSAIQTSFVHAVKTGKSDTNTLTKVKELISMWQIQSKVEKGAFLSEDQIIEKLGSLKQHYTSIYNESAIKQANALKSSLSLSRGYVYERQKDNLTRPIYAKAIELTKKAPDNWNPADIWMIKSGLDLSKIENSITPEELNGRIAELMKQHKLIPVSLKQVTKNAAKLELIDPNRILSTNLNLDLSLNKANITGSFNNFMVHTNSGFTVRGGFKGSSDTLSVSLEGSFQGAGSQLGGIDAKEYAKHVKTLHGYEIRGGTRVSEDSYDTAIQELREMYDKYGTNLSLSMKTFDQALNVINAGNDLLRKRSINLISYLYSFLSISGDEKFEDHMKLCYFLAKKISSTSCSYYLLHNA